MLVIGERINSSIKKIEEAIQAKDTAFIQREAQQQVAAGADVIDLNAGTFLKTEPEELVWLLRTVNEVIDPEIGLALDSANPEALQAGLAELEQLSRGAEDNKPIINSVTAEPEKLATVLPLVKKYDAQLVGLCMSAHGIPDEPEKRAALGSEILNAATENQIPASDIYLDPLVLPVSTDTKKGSQALETLRLLKFLNPEVKTIIGLSNISYGLPEKPLLNQAFMVMAMVYGLDAAILNPLDKRLMSMIKAGEVILGNDDYCMNYIKAYRAGELE
ncbi:dihydropteroate synthase [[Eubacterium] cellulosolvens]